MSSFFKGWESVDDACDTSLRTCYHAVACYPCVYGAALHRLVYNSRIHVPLCVGSAWWCVGTVPCLGAVCIRARVGPVTARNFLRDTACCACTGAPCNADDYRVHDSEIHDLLVKYDDCVLPPDTFVLPEADEADDLSDGGAN